MAVWLSSIGDEKQNYKRIHIIDKRFTTGRRIQKIATIDIKKEKRVLVKFGDEEMYTNVYDHKTNNLQVSYTYYSIVYYDMKHF